MIAGKNVLEPISIHIPAAGSSSHAAVYGADDEYGKVKSKKKSHWQRGSIDHIESQQLKITDLFNV